MRRGLLIPTLVFAATVVTNTAMAVQSAELYRTQAYFYGRFEARVQYAPGSGVVSSFFLWKDGSSSTTLWNELDYEKLNADCRMQTNAWTGMGGVQHTQINAMPGNICTGYHTYSFEWTPTYIAWFVDGVEIRRETGAIAADYVANASAGMKIHFNVWPGDATFGGAFSPSILPVHEYISWMQYSSYVNGTFQLQWREEFNGTGVPSGWAEGDWASPYSNSTHNPANVNYVNGIAVLSLTADGATGYTGTPPPDNSGTGSGGTGSSSAGGSSTGGSQSTGGAVITGGAKSTGGATASGGTATATGGAKSTGGAVASGGATTATGGAKSTGGVTASGGAATATGGAKSTGGATASGGTATVTGGSLGTGGASATGGSPSTGIVPASGGSSSTTSNSGGMVAATGGASSAIAAGAVAGSVSGTASGDPDGSCNCKLADARTSSPMRGILAILLGLAMLRARRVGRTTAS